MKPATRVIKNTGVEVASNVFNMLLSAVFTFAVAREFGPELYGIFSIVTTFPLIFNSFILFGLDCILIRDIARDKDNAGKVLCNAILYQIFLSVLTFIIITIVMTMIGYDSDTKMNMSFFYFFCVITSIATVNSTAFRAFERMEFNSILNTGEKIIVLILGIAALMKSYRVGGIIAVFIIAGLLKLFASMFISFKKFSKWDMTFDSNIWKYFVKEGYSAALSSFFTSFRWNIVILLISKMLTVADAGYYNAAFKLTYPILLITFAYSTAILPIMSVSYVTSREKLLRISRMSCKIAMTLTLPISILISYCSEEIITLILGDKFIASASVLRIIIWILPFSFLVYPLGNVLVAVNYQRDAMIANGINALLMLGGEIVLTVKYGLLGACTGLVAAEALLAVMYLYSVTVRFQYIGVSEFLLKPLLSGISMFAAILLFSGSGKIAAGAAGIIVYIILVYYSKVFKSDEVQKVREALNI